MLKMLFDSMIKKSVSSLSKYLLHPDITCWLLSYYSSWQKELQKAIALKNHLQIVSASFFGFFFT